jgi:hypothetical protein
MGSWVLQRTSGEENEEGKGRVASESSGWWRRPRLPETKETTFSGRVAARGGSQEGVGEVNASGRARGAFYREGEAVPVASRRRHDGGGYKCAGEVVMGGGMVGGVQ